jgi:GAF domain-containing protein
VTGGNVVSGQDDSARAALLIEAGLALSSELDLDAVLSRIVELAVELTGARYGALGVLGEDTPRIERFITRGVTDEAMRRPRCSTTPPKKLSSTVAV